MRRLCLQKLVFLLVVFVFSFLSLSLFACQNTQALDSTFSRTAFVWYDGSQITSQSITQTGQMILYPVATQRSGLMRFLFYPHIPAGNAQGIRIQGINLSVYVDESASITVDTNFCNHIKVGGGVFDSASWTVSNCYYNFDPLQGNNWVNFHFDLIGSFYNQQSVSDDGSFYVTIGTYNDNEINLLSIVGRAGDISSSYPLYFGSLTWANVELATNASDSLLEQNNALLNDISNKLDNFQDDEQQKYEDQSEDVQNQLEDGSSASEQQGQTLISMLTEFFTAIRDVPASTGCDINLNLRPYNDSLPANYAISLCQPKVKAFLTQGRYNPISGVSTYSSIWSILSSVIFSCIIIGLLSPTLNLIKKTYEELRK